MSIPDIMLATPAISKFFADEEAANRWLEENDPEGVAFEYEVQE